MTNKISAVLYHKRKSLKVRVMLFIVQDTLTRDLSLPIHPEGAIMTRDPHVPQILLCSGTASPTAGCSMAYSESRKGAARMAMCLPPLFVLTSADL